MENQVGRIRIYEDGGVYYVKSAVDAVSATIYTGCTNCAHMIKEGTTKCPRCGQEQQHG